MTITLSSLLYSKIVWALLLLFLAVFSYYFYRMIQEIRLTLRAVAGVQGEVEKIVQNAKEMAPVLNSISQEVAKQAETIKEMTSSGQSAVSNLKKLPGEAKEGRRDLKLILDYAQQRKKDRESFRSELQNAKEEGIRISKHFGDSIANLFRKIFKKSKSRLKSLRLFD